MRWLLVLALVWGCGPQKSPRTMRYAEITLTGSLVGVLATSLGAAATSMHPDIKDAMIATDIGFGALAVGSLVVYLVADIYDEEPSNQTAQQKADEEAWDMTKRARDAARKGDCERVKKIEPTVKAKDPSFHDVVFMRDAAIARCLQAH